jgi:Na+/melibiose symporter-like transporter
MMKGSIKLFQREITRALGQTRSEPTTPRSMWAAVLAFCACGARAAVPRGPSAFHFSGIRLEVVLWQATMVVWGLLGIVAIAACWLMYARRLRPLDLAGKRRLKQLELRIRAAVIASITTLLFLSPLVAVDAVLTHPSPVHAVQQVSTPQRSFS